MSDTQGNVAAPTSGGGVAYFRAITTEMTSLMKVIGDQTEKGSPRFLQVIGATFLFFSFGTKVFVTIFPSLHPENFSSLDFLACVAVGLILIASGAAIKVYEYKNAISLARDRLNLGKALVEFGGQSSPGTIKVE